MEDFKSAIDTAYAKLHTDGKVAAIIEKQLTETVTRTVSELLQPYSDFGKSLKAHLQQKLAIDFKTANLRSYNDIVLEVLESQIAGIVDKVARTELSQQVQTLLGGDVPATIKISDLVEQFKKQACDIARRDSDHEITADFEKGSYGSCWLNLDPRAGKSKHECQFRIHLSDDGTVHGLRITEFGDKKTLFFGHVYGFELQLFMMRAAGTKIEIDTTDFDLSYPEHDE